MKQACRLACAVVLAMAGEALAQAPQAPPKPGPELEKLDYFVGKWAIEGELKPGPMGPGGRMTSTDSCEWFAGGFHLVCRGEGKGPMGETKGLGILGYSAEDKAYTYSGIDNFGTAEAGRGSLAGDTWTWSGDFKMGGKPMKSRYVVKQGSPDAYTFKWEISEDGKAWTVVAEGRETRVK